MQTLSFSTHSLGRDYSKVVLSPRISFVVCGYSSGVNLVARCKGFGGTELKARDVCSVRTQCHQREAFVS